MLKRITNGLVLAVLLAMPVYFIAVSIQEEDPNPLVSLVRGTMEYTVADYMPYSLSLQQLGLDLRLLSGQSEQNGIFISESGLMRNIDPPMSPKIADNVREINSFSRALTDRSGGRKSTYLAIVPTASGVLTQNLPRFAQTENQQRLIEEIYSDLSLGVRTVDAYSALQNRRDQYIYYRTDNSLTALGGYYAYNAVARRMEFNNRSINQYAIEYVDNAFYGGLYGGPQSTVKDWGGSTAPYRKVEPDTIALFRYTGNREYVVTKRSGGEERMYHTLYPFQRMELGSGLDIYLGGSAAVTEIRSSYPSRNRLLVFGDKTAQAVLPFLVNHFSEVKLVNLFQASVTDLEAVNPQQYDQVLFLYGIETFIHTSQPAQVKNIQWAAG